MKLETDVNNLSIIHIDNESAEVECRFSYGYYRDSTDTLNPYVQNNLPVDDLSLKKDCSLRHASHRKL